MKKSIYEIDRVGRFQKRAFDILFSTLVLVVLSPLFVITAVLIKIDSPGAILYCPKRVGRNGKVFRMYKFRSMSVDNSHGHEIKSTVQGDNRITRVGQVIRKYSIDELPQFLNVLLGDMSVVGPRPHRCYLHKTLADCVPNYLIRENVKPGITGWAQVNGWRGPTDTAEQRNERTRHDLWYIENWSFKTDIKIIINTIVDVKVHQAAF